MDELNSGIPTDNIGGIVETKKTSKDNQRTSPSPLPKSCLRLRGILPKCPNVNLSIQFLVPEIAIANQSSIETVFYT